MDDAVAGNWKRKLNKGGLEWPTLSYAVTWLKCSEAEISTKLSLGCYNLGIFPAILNVRQKRSDVWAIRVMEALHIVSQEELLTKVNHKYPKAGKIRERKESGYEFFCWAIKPLEAGILN